MRRDVGVNSGGKSRGSGRSPAGTPAGRYGATSLLPGVGGDNKDMDSGRTSSDRTTEPAPGVAPGRAQRPARRGSGERAAAAEQEEQAAAERARRNAQAASRARTRARSEE